MRESSLRPAGRRYSLKDHGTQFDSNRIGTHVLKKTSNCDYWKPSWKGTETVIRIYPALNPENPEEWDAFRLSTEHLHFGDWIRTYPCVRNFGDPGITMLLHDPSEEGAYDPMSNPAWVLYYAIENACKNGLGKPEWYPLREFAQGRGRRLSKPTQVGLVQCAIMRHNNKDFCDANTPPKGGASEDRPVIFEMSSSAFKVLFALLEEKDEDWKGDEDDIRQYKYGDIVSLDAGAYVHFFERGHDPRTKNTPNKNKSAFGGQRKSAESGDTEVRGFDCFIDYEFMGQSASLPEEAEEMVRGKWRPWDEILQFYNHEEQAHLINGCFPPSAIIHAFRDHPEWIDSSTKRAAVSTKTVDMHVDEEPEEQPKPAARGWGSMKKAQPKAEVNVDEALPEGGIDDNFDEDNDPSLIISSDADEIPEDAFDKAPEEKKPTAEAMSALEEARKRTIGRKRKPE